MRQEINLYNPALRARREWLTGRGLLYALGLQIVLLGVYGGVLHWENRQLSVEAERSGAELARRQEELARLNDAVAQRKVGAETQAELQRVEAALLDRERIREALGDTDLGSSDGFSAFLRAFARQTQDGLWLVELRMAEGGRDITLAGRTLDPDRIPRYLRGLNSESALRGRTFETLNLQRVAEADQRELAKAGTPAGSAAQAEATQKAPPYYEFLLTAAGAAAPTSGAAQGEATQNTSPHHEPLLPAFGPALDATARQGVSR